MKFILSLIYLAVLSSTEGLRTSLLTESSERILDEGHHHRHGHAHGHKDEEKHENKHENKRLRQGTPKAKGARHHHHEDKDENEVVTRTGKLDDEPKTTNKASSKEKSKPVRKSEQEATTDEPKPRQIKIPKSKKQKVSPPTADKPEPRKAKIPKVQVQVEGETGQAPKKPKVAALQDSKSPSLPKGQGNKSEKADSIPKRGPVPKGLRGEANAVEEEKKAPRKHKPRPHPEQKSAVTPRKPKSDPDSASKDPESPSKEEGAKTGRRAKPPKGVRGSASADETQRVEEEAAEKKKTGRAKADFEGETDTQDSTSPQDEAQGPVVEDQIPESEEHEDGKDEEVFDDNGDADGETSVEVDSEADEYGSDTDANQPIVDDKEDSTTSNNEQVKEDHLASESRVVRVSIAALAIEYNTSSKQIPTELDYLELLRVTDHLLSTMYSWFFENIKAVKYKELMIHQYKVISPRIVQYDVSVSFSKSGHHVIPSLGQVEAVVKQGLSPTGHFYPIYLENLEKMPFGIFSSTKSFQIITDPTKTEALIDVSDPPVSFSPSRESKTPAKWIVPAIVAAAALSFAFCLLVSMCVYRRMREREFDAFEKDASTAVETEFRSQVQRFDEQHLFHPEDFHGGYTSDGDNESSDDETGKLVDVNLGEGCDDTTDSESLLSGFYEYGHDYDRASEDLEVGGLLEERESLMSDVEAKDDDGPIVAAVTSAIASLPPWASMKLKPVESAQEQSPKEDSLRSPEEDASKAEVSQALGFAPVVTKRMLADNAWLVSSDKTHGQELDDVSDGEDYVDVDGNTSVKSSPKNVEASSREPSIGAPPNTPETNEVEGQHVMAVTLGNSIFTSPHANQANEEATAHSKRTLADDSWLLLASKSSDQDPESSPLETTNVNELPAKMATQNVSTDSYPPKTKNQGDNVAASSNLVVTSDNQPNDNNVVQGSNSEGPEHERPVVCFPPAKIMKRTLNGEFGGGLVNGEAKSSVDTNSAATKSQGRKNETGGFGVELKAVLSSGDKASPRLGSKSSEDHAAQSSNNMRDKHELSPTPAGVSSASLQAQASSDQASPSISPVESGQHLPAWMRNRAGLKIQYRGQTGQGSSVTGESDTQKSAHENTGAAGKDQEKPYPEPSSGKKSDEHCGKNAVSPDLSLLEHASPSQPLSAMESTQEDDAVSQSSARIAKGKAAVEPPTTSSFEEAKNNFLQKLEQNRTTLDKLNCATGPQVDQESSSEGSSAVLGAMDSKASSEGGQNEALPQHDDSSDGGKSSIGDQPEADNNVPVWMRKRSEILCRGKDDVNGSDNSDGSPAGSGSTKAVPEWMARFKQMGLDN